MLILAGIRKGDTESHAEYLADRISKIRIFRDAEGKMNLDLREAGGSVLVAPNFTLYGDCRKGRRPGFEQAARPEEARPLFEFFVNKLRESGIRAETGVFGADMEVSLVNDGPVTFVLDSL